MARETFKLTRSKKGNFFIKMDARMMHVFQNVVHRAFDGDELSGIDKIVLRSMYDYCWAWNKLHTAINGGVMSKALNGHGEFDEIIEKEIEWWSKEKGIDLASANEMKCTRCGTVVDRIEVIRCIETRAEPHCPQCPGQGIDGKRLKLVPAETATPGKDVTWEVVERPGYFGKRRPELVAGFDSKYGHGKWKELWEVGGKLVDFKDAIAHYEDSYYQFLKNNVELLDELCKTAKNVYDNNETNVYSGTDYSKQETVARHYQDIAVRRSIERLGRKFEGKALVQVRTVSKDIGAKLTPGIIPFHDPSVIRKPELAGWWSPGTVESFWQSNKVIVVQKSKLKANIVTPRVQGGR